MTLASSGGLKMKDFWEYAKGIAYVLVLIIGVYLGLAEGHEWWPFNQNTGTSNSDYSEELSDDYWKGYDAGFDDGYIWGYYDGKESVE